MLAATLVSLGVVFLAELGDKSQIMTMTYALRHRWWVVLSGVGIASFLVHGLSVTIGHVLGLTLPERPIACAAAVVFLLFALWTWRDGRDNGEEGLRTVAEPRHVLLAVISSFVLAELGDKTMLLHKRLPERLLHRMAGVLFLLFGLWMLFDGALGWRWLAITTTGSVAAVAVSMGVVGALRHRRAAVLTAARPDAQCRLWATPATWSRPAATAAYRAMSPPP